MLSVIILIVKQERRIMGRNKSKNPKRNRHAFRINDDDERRFKKNFKKSKYENKSEFIRDAVLSFN